MMKIEKYLISVIPLVIFGLIWAGGVRAGVNDNVSGFAWSENIGWVSFNSSNCDIDNDGT